MSEAELKHNPFAEAFDAVGSKIEKADPRTAFAQALNKVKSKDARKNGYKDVVTNSSEFSRIMKVPVRDLDLENVTDLTSIFRKDGGTMQLRPIQNAALIEACYANGLFGPIGVGHGKTLITLLMPEAMDSERAVLLVPPQLRDQLAREIEEVYGPHFNLPLERIVRILAYSELSLAKNTGLLDELNPDLIILDEAHNLRRPTSARTKRFRRYMRENPHCRLVALSGTMTSRSILDYAHLLELCLRKNSPLPNNHNELKLWSGALDVRPTSPVDPGVLRHFVQPEDEGNVRVGFRRRLVGTRGVVATEKGALGTSLLVRIIQPEFIPASVTEALEEVHETWAYNGEEYASPISFWRFCRQMSCGFYYRWVWPEGGPSEQDVAWLEARAAWKREVRERLKTGGQGLDSELLVTNAAERWRKSVEDHSDCEGEWVGEDHSKCTKRKFPCDAGDACGDEDCQDGDCGMQTTEYDCKVDPDHPEDCTRKGKEWVAVECKIYPDPDHRSFCTGVNKLRPAPDAKLFPCEEYITWKKVKTLYNPTPPTEAVMIDPFLVDDAIKRAQKYVDDGRKVIVWYESTVIGELLHEKTGWPLYGAGTDASPSKEDVIICSMATQATGKNLQHYNTNITTTMPTNGKLYEQKAGRTHRPGQLSDLVIDDCYGHTDALDKCMNDVINDAMYIEDSTGQRQKILYADGEGIHQKKIAQKLINSERQKQIEAFGQNQNQNQNQEQTEE